ncbi:MAG: hypothetical protein ABI603_09665 [Acidobacteriota bacterium]
MIAVSQAGMLARISPFYHWHTPIAWTGYILLVDGWVWQRRGASWRRNHPAELFFLACVSVPLWALFEIYNKYSLGNWYYVGLPDNLPLRYAGYVWAFATIWPAIFETADLVSSLRDRRAAADRIQPPRIEPPGAAGWLAVAAGALMLLAPVALRHTAAAPYLAAPVWLGFIFLLDPLNARAGAESLLGDWRRGRNGRAVNLLIAGLVCGLLWEFWNYWGGTKWIYNVPVPPHVKLFEMPLAGYGGFPAFALECFVMYAAVRRWLWRGVPRPVAL